MKNEPDNIHTPAKFFNNTAAYLWTSEDGVSTLTTSWVLDQPARTPRAASLNGNKDKEEDLAQHRLRYLLEAPTRASIDPGDAKTYWISIPHIIADRISPRFSKTPAIQIRSQIEEL